MDQDTLSEPIMPKTNDAALAAFISAKTDDLLPCLSSLKGRVCSGFGSSLTGSDIPAG